MGLLGGLLMLGGLGTVLLGLVGVVLNLWMGQYAEAGESALMVLGGLVAGGVGTAILE